jgi:hypothetical protein
MPHKLTINGIALAMAAALPLSTGNAPSVNEYVILVAERDTPAFEHASSAANDQTVFAERRLFRGLQKAAELLNQPGQHTVRLLVAAGQYTGQTNRGVWVLPPIDNVEGALHILGGFNDTFSARAPFTHVSELVTIQGRDGAFIQLGARSKLRELVISGFLFDAGPSNAYDARTNSILKGQSRSYPMISFTQLATDHLVIADNIFLNGAHGAFDPFIVPASAQTVIDIQNNFFLNTIKTMKPAAATSRGNSVAAINIRHNSFLLNWPFNPDATSSNVSAIELYHSDGAQAVNIEGNVFAFNPGGAMQHDWPDDRMPDMTIRNNLFYMNAGLFENGAADAGIIVGKFGTNPRYMVLDMASVEDDFDYTVTGNVAIDPQIPITLSAPLEAANSASVERKATVLNDVRRLFGLNQDGGTVAIANFAPRMTWTPESLPLAQNEAARQYGVQVAGVLGGR